MQSDKYKVDLSATIGKVLPFYMRGRKVSLFLEAILKPIEMLHEAWVRWSEERIIDTSMTSQPLAIAWYLKHKLYDHLINKSDEFLVKNGIDSPTSILFTESESFKSDEYSQHVYCMDENMEVLTMTVMTKVEVIDDNINFAIIAPEVKETSMYDEDDYKHEITRLVNNYNTSFKTYQIIIQ